MYTILCKVLVRTKKTKARVIPRLDFYDYTTLVIFCMISGAIFATLRS